MRTFEIDFGREPLKGDIPDEPESNRINFGMIEMRGESLMRHLFKFSFLHFSELTRPL
jgi:hypothetical protein